MLSNNGELGYKVDSRINATSMKWGSRTGVLWSTYQNLQYVTRSVTLYGSECWLIIKDKERCLPKILIWASGVTRHYHIHNEDIREWRLRRYGHIIRADQNSFAKIGLKVEVGGKRPKGRPKQLWPDTLDDDLRASRLQLHHAYERAKWHASNQDLVGLTSLFGAKK